jgi:2-amino-4-hydroxy-6-hydroxymethyldihydropteridine diphosphokinase
MITCYIALGSNLENPVQQLNNARLAMEAIDSIKLIKMSSYYKSAPYGGINQPDFINAVAKIETELNAGELLNCMFKIESDQGRQRGKEKWGPRTIDLDLLTYGQEIIQDKGIIVPHPEISNRNFVLYPLYELEKNLDIPDLGPLENLLKKSTMDGLQILA